MLPAVVPKFDQPMELKNDIGIAGSTTAEIAHNLTGLTSWTGKPLVFDFACKYESEPEVKSNALTWMKTEL